jgi:hypothetical protein
LSIKVTSQLKAFLTAASFKSIVFRTKKTSHKKPKSFDSHSPLLKEMARNKSLTDIKRSQRITLSFFVCLCVRRNEKIVKIWIPKALRLNRQKRKSNLCLCSWWLHYVQDFRETFIFELCSRFQPFSICSTQKPYFRNLQQTFKTQKHTRKTIVPNNLY